jgi:hypothetical protein|tara:strand:+ start:751 stop:912 length:162 start_codon:yes stop_codon:yes gene_type:complete
LELDRAHENKECKSVTACSPVLQCIQQQQQQTPQGQETTKKGQLEGYVNKKTT